MKDIDKFINDESISKEQRGSYIVGATMMRDDYYDIIVIEPEIETLAEMGADFEVTSPSNIYYNLYFNDILEKIKEIKTKYNIK